MDNHHRDDDVDLMPPAGFRICARGFRVRSSTPSCCGLRANRWRSLELKQTPGDGESDITVATLKGVAKLGQFTMNHPQIGFIDEMAFGNIGREILQRFVVTLDSKNRRIRLESRPGRE